MTKRVRRGMAMIAAMLLIMLDISSAYAAPEADDKEADMDAGGAVLMEKDTGIVLLSKNAHQKLPMASTTKIMTALVVIENCSLGDQYWGVAQRRRRIFLVADFAGDSAPAILFEPDSLYGNPAQS